MWILAASPTPRAAEAGCRAELLLLSRVQVAVFWALLLGVDLLRMSDFGPRVGASPFLLLRWWYLREASWIPALTTLFNTFY